MPSTTAGVQPFLGRSPSLMSSTSGVCHSRGSATSGSGAGGVAGGDVVVDEGAEPFSQFVVRASQRREMLAVNEDRAVGRLTGTGQADADVCRLRFARTIHNAAHDGAPER